MEDNKDKMVYYMTLDLFIKSNNRNPQENNEDLFPTEWYQIDDYRTRINILSEAMNKKVNINQTDLFLELTNHQTLSK